MNLVTFIIITVLTIAFVVYMARRTFGILLDMGPSLQKTILQLNNLRMSTMFISFLGTIAGAISFIFLFLENADIIEYAKYLAFIVTISFATLFSFQLSSTLVASEQTLGEKLTDKNKKKWALVLVLILSTLDYYSMSIGGTAFAKNIQNKKIQEVKESNTVLSSAIKTDNMLLQQKIAELKQVNSLLNNPDKIEVVDSKEATHYKNRINKWKAELKKAKSKRDIATYERYIAINEQKLKEELASLKEFKLEELKMQKETLNKDINKIRASIVNNAKYIDKKTDRATKTATKEADKTASNISIVAFMIVLFNISLGFVSGRLNSQESLSEAIQNIVIDEDNELEAIKPVKEVGKTKKELQEDYIAEAMKIYAKEQNYIPNEYGTVYLHRYKFPRDAIVDKAKQLAAKDGIKLEIGNTTAKRIIDMHKSSDWLEKHIKDQAPPQYDEAA